MDKRKVVEVPRESKASPGAERETTVAELSPVNGAMIQSRTVALIELYCKKNNSIDILDRNPQRFIHQSHIVPRVVPPDIGSGPSLDRKVVPPHMFRSLSSHLHVSTSMRFIPLASEISIGAIAPRNREGKKDETKDIREVERYASGYRRNILKEMSRYQIL